MRTADNFSLPTHLDELSLLLSVDRYTWRTPHVHMYSHSTDHTAQMKCVQWLKTSCALKNMPSSMRHVSPFAARDTEHFLTFSLFYLYCVTVVLFSTYPIIHCEDPRQDVTSTEFHSSTGYEPKKDRAQQDSGQTQHQIIDDQDDIEETGVKQLSCSESLVHSACDSAESIATPPDSDLEDEQLRKMLSTPLKIREREENEGQTQAYHSERESLMIHSSRYQGNLMWSVYRSEKQMHNEHKQVTTQDWKVCSKFVKRSRSFRELDAMFSRHSESSQNTFFERDRSNESGNRFESSVHSVLKIC